MICRFDRLRIEKLYEHWKSYQPPTHLISYIVLRFTLVWPAVYILLQHCIKDMDISIFIAEFSSAILSWCLGQQCLFNYLNIHGKFLQYSWKPQKFSQANLSTFMAVITWVLMICIPSGLWSQDLGIQIS